MGKNKKFFKNKKKSSTRPITKKKPKSDEPVNKKALFNRYKDKQKVEIVKEKQLRFEKEIQRRHVEYSESEEEDDAYGQLVSCFSKSGNKATVHSESSESDMSEDEEKEEAAKVASDGPTVEEHKQANEQTDDEIQEHDLADESDVDEGDPEEDPFNKHFLYDLSDELLLSLSNKPPITEQVNKTLSVLGNVMAILPKPIVSRPKLLKPKFSILEEKTYAAPAVFPSIIENVNFDNLHIKSQVQGNLVSANKKILIKNDLELNDIMTPLQKELFSILNNYHDLHYPERTFVNADEIRYTYCLHAVNHMLKTRSKIVHHNAKLAKKQNSSDEYRDQGLVRPKVLIMVPFKDAAYRIVKTIIEILVPKESGQVVNKNRFEEDFTGDELLMPKKNPKPEDYELLFSGNTDDTFRLGMTLTKKTLKLYTDFYSSDIIIASPLGLRMIVGAEGEEDRDYDFLASIEILVMDQADVFYMQNWDHLLHVLDHFHLQPKKTRNTDFSRVRSWAVNGWSKYYRQTLVFSSVVLPQIKALLNKKCFNYAGKVFVNNSIETGSIRQVVMQIPQVFHRFNAASPLEAVDARFDYFVKEMLPKQRDPLMSHTLIYVPSYFDYVRIRNYFKKEDIGFVQICEYSKDAKIARARDMFFHSEAHFLLYSERAHFFRRLRVKAVRHLLFYQPPSYPHFYAEMCNLMQESNQNKYGGSEFNMSVSVLYCRYDAAALSALAGAGRARRLLAADQPLHAYLTAE